MARLFEGAGGAQREQAGPLERCTVRGAGEQVGDRELGRLEGRGLVLDGEDLGHPWSVGFAAAVDDHVDRLRHQAVQRRHRDLARRVGQLADEPEA